MEEDLGGGRAGRCLKLCSAGLGQMQSNLKSLISSVHLKEAGLGRLGYERWDY